MVRNNLLPFLVKVDCKFEDEDAIFPKDLVDSDIKHFFFFLNYALMNNHYARLSLGSRLNLTLMILQRNCTKETK